MAKNVFKKKKTLIPEIYFIELIFKPNFKTLFFLMLGVPLTFSKITKTPYYTLNIDRLTKPQKFNVKDISIRHIKKRSYKILCNHGVPFAQILRKSVKTYAGNL